MLACLLSFFLSFFYFDYQWALHTLLVITTSDLEQVTLEFITERITENLFNNKETPISKLPRNQTPSLFSTDDFGFLVVMFGGKNEMGRTRQKTDFSSHALLQERTELALIIDLDDLL